MLTLNVEGQVGTRLPMNYLILESGKQQLDITVLPILGEMSFIENSSFRATVMLYDVVDGFKFIKDFVTYKMPDIDEENLIPVFNYQTVFHAEVPYKLVAWQNSKDLSEIEDLRQKVEERYRFVENLIVKGQYSALQQMLQERENNVAISMYLSEDEKKSRLNEFIHDAENGFKVVPHTIEDQLVVYGNNKLVSLRKIDGDSALLLSNDETEEDLFLDIQFHIKQDGNELTII